MSYICRMIMEKEFIRVRVVSVGFVVLALAIFKPFGLAVWQWEAYAHLLAVGVLGFGVCLLTEAILTYIVGKPRSAEPGIEYIIRRNLWFQLINTPLVSLMICLYRDRVLSNRMESNHLSWSNFLETLAIIAFCSFAIGLYWRFKFRSRYLAAELEETRLLNEQLSRSQTTSIPSQPPSAVTLTGNTSETVTLRIPDLLYIEAVGNYVKVFQLRDGQVQSDLLRATMKQMEEALHGYPSIVRCHRAFLVNLGQVEQIISHSGSTQLLIRHGHESLPVSRSNMSKVKDAIKLNTFSHSLTAPGDGAFLSEGT